MKKLKFTCVGLLAVAAVVQGAFAQLPPGPPPIGGGLPAPPMGGPPAPSMGGGPGDAASSTAGNVRAPSLGGNGAPGNVVGGTLNSSSNVSVLRGSRDSGSEADHRPAVAPGAAAGAEAESAAGSECDQNAMQICWQDWGYCSDVCKSGDDASQQSCWTGCTNRYNHCKLASRC